MTSVDPAARDGDTQKAPAGSLYGAFSVSVVAPTDRGGIIQKSPAGSLYSAFSVSVVAPADRGGIIQKAPVGSTDRASLRSSLSATPAAVLTSSGPDRADCPFQSHPAPQPHRGRSLAPPQPRRWRGREPQRTAGGRATASLARSRRHASRSPRRAPTAQHRSATACNRLQPHNHRHGTVTARNRHNTGVAVLPGFRLLGHRARTTVRPPACTECNA